MSRGRAGRAERSRLGQAPWPRRAAPRVLLALALALGTSGSRCAGGDGGGGGAAVVKVRSPDPRCSALPDAFGFPPDFGFIPGAPGRVLAATFQERLLVPLDVRRTPFRVPAAAEPTLLPADADGDGRPEPVQLIDGLTLLARDLALVTLSGYEALVAVDPDGGLRELVLEAPPPPGPGFDPTLAVDPADLLLWPAPGEAEVRTGVPNFTCIHPPAGARDSRGTPVEAAVVARAGCPCVPPSFCASFSAGTARAADRLFVAVSNVGESAGREDTQFLPGALTVYALDPSGGRPRVRAQATPDGGAFLYAGDGVFNLTHAQAHRDRNGREWLLATATGAIGVREDDLDTDEIESGARRLTDGSVEVFDPETLTRVARYPLRRGNPSFTGVAVDPSRRIGAVGDVTARRVYVLDLTELERLPASPAPGAPPLDLSHAVLFDGRDPLAVPHREDGAPLASCPGWVESLAWSERGDALYALEACDGTLSIFDVRPGDDAPERRDFALRSVQALTAPLRADSLGQPRSPSKLRVRPGLPGVDFSGPELFFLVSDPEALLCGFTLEGGR